MARIRQIKPDFYLDDDLALCSREARLMFPGLWMLADRAGRLEDRPARIKAQVFPYDEDISAREVENFLEQLAAHGFIIRYQAAGKNLIQIRTFEKHQHCHIKEPNSQLPPPEELTEKPGASTVPAPVLHRSSPSAFTSTYSNGFLSVGVGSEDWSISTSVPENGSKNTHTPAADFVLTDELRSWSEAAAPDIDPEAETEKFRDYYGRNGKTFADLSAAWRKWIRDAVERQNQARAPTGRRESRPERNARIIREIEAEDRMKAMS